jgi:hypothetical protein
MVPRIAVKIALDDLFAPNNAIESTPGQTP